MLDHVCEAGPASAKHWDNISPLTTAHDYIRPFSIVYYHFKSYTLNILKVKRDINQQDLKIV